MFEFLRDLNKDIFNELFMKNVNTIIFLYLFKERIIRIVPHRVLC